MSSTNGFAYNPRSEVTDAAMGASTYSYSYDDIGNRAWSAENALTNTYAANSLNQYTNILCVPAPLRLDYDADGNMLTNGVWSYARDAENRMTGAASNGVPAVSNAYDHRHRRIRKETAAGTRLFAYDGWNLTAEVFVDSQTGATNVTRYLCGPDLSGTLQGAGGVGGLLAEIRGDGSMYFPCYDANGNVTDYVDAYGNVRGHFEYDAFGNTVAMWGDLAHTFRFRFSTKYWDDETRSYYYGYRHYAPKLGCWLSRDPIGEIGGEKLYGFAYNNPQNLFDPLGQDASSLPPLGGANNNRIVLDEARVTCRICELGKLCIRVNSPKAPLLDQLNQLATSKGLKGGHDSGHTFLLGVLRSQGGKESREGIGFWPDLSIAWSFFGGHRGDIRDDSKEHWSHQICFSMCPATWEKIKKNKQGQAPIYNVFVTQCSTWALVTTLDVGYRHGFRMMRPVTPEEIKKYDRARLFLTKKFFELTSILPISISQKATEPYELARMPGFSPQ